jgi:hypothetical protein
MLLPVSDRVGGDADSFCNIFLVETEVQPPSADVVAYGLQFQRIGGILRFLGG